MTGLLTMLAIAVAIAVVWGVRDAVLALGRRDLAFVGIAPGIIPAPGDEHRVATARSTVVAVRFTPPDDLGVGEVGALWSKKLRARDVTAMVVDLAVRGLLRIEEMPSSTEDRGDWTLVKLPRRGTFLRGYEAALLRAIFGKRKSARMSVLRRTFARDRVVALDAVEKSLITGELINHRLSNRPHLTQRTALGRAYHEQARGFERYIATAEARQLGEEELTETFSRYLPYAIVFGLADRWAAVFREAGGGATSGQDWYVSSDSGSRSDSSDTDASDFTTGVTDFSDSSSTYFLSNGPSSDGGSGWSWGGDGGDGGGSDGGGGDGGDGGGGGGGD